MFYFNNTNLCEPPDPAFQAWLATVDDRRTSGIVCNLPGGFVGFEVPFLGTEPRQLINPYVDTTTGVSFTVEPGGFGDEVVGLVKNSATSACVEPADDDQKLGTGRSSLPPEGSVGLSGFPIRATFPTLLPAPVTISVDFQALAGSSARLRLFDDIGTVVASTTQTVLLAGGTCGLPGGPRARKTVSVASNKPVAFAIMDVPTTTGDKVFVIDNFSFIPGEKPSAIELVSFTATAGAQGVTLAWETASEIDNEGFNLWRSTTEGGQYTKINSSLIPAKGSADAGAKYEYLDTQVVKRMTYYYQLEDVDSHGASVFHGVVSTAPAATSPLYLPLIVK
jgi:hypothetical protein